MSPTSYSELYGDTCTPSSDCWAVGYYQNSASARLGQALHFNGTRWSRVSVPEPGGTGGAADYGYLNAVACTSSSNCWAVGYYGNKAGASLNEALRWNGSKWTEFSTPQPAGKAGSSDRNRLNGVACTSRSDCWAVGDYTNTAGAHLNEALRWNGKNWRAFAMPNPNGTAKGEENVAYAVSCTVRLHCLAVGYGHNRARAYLNEALRWNGKSWAKLSTPQPGGTAKNGYGYLQGLACPTASVCWADGGHKNSAGAYVNEVLRWNGRGWTQVATPQPGGKTFGADNQLVALSCMSPSDCWAVGYSYNTHGAALNEALQWNGSRWSSAGTPQPGGTGRNEGNVLYGISCASSTECWAVGYTSQSAGRPLNQALLWNGSSWSVG